MKVPLKEELKEGSQVESKVAFKVALLGARGLIGTNFLSILSKKYQNIDIKCFGFSEDKQVSFGSKTLNIMDISLFIPNEYDFIFTAINEDKLLELKEKIMNSKAIWIDKSSLLRLEKDVALIVPEINMEESEGKKIIASPNCVVIPVAMFLSAIKEFVCLDVNITTYQSISGAGKQAMDAFFKELKIFQIKNMYQGLFYKDPMAFNIISAIGEIDEQGFSQEELKIEQELRKILKLDCAICVTSMRVPVMRVHTISLNFTLQKDVTIEQIIKKIEQIGILYYNLPVASLTIAGENTVIACRLRKHGKNLYSIILMCDNLLKGGALNAFQIFERLLENALEGSSKNISNLLSEDILKK